MQSNTGSQQQIFGFSQPAADSNSGFLSARGGFPSSSLFGSNVPASVPDTNARTSGGFSFPHSQNQQFSTGPGSFGLFGQSQTSPFGSLFGQVTSNASSGGSSDKTFSAIQVS